MSTCSIIFQFTVQNEFNYEWFFLLLIFGTMTERDIESVKGNKAKDITIGARMLSQVIVESLYEDVRVFTSSTNVKLTRE